MPGAGSEPGDAAIAKANAGKKLPIVGRVEISIIEEAQPRLLALQQRRSSTTSSCRRRSPTTCSTNGTLLPEYAKRGVVLHRQVEPSLSFTFFNLDDPVVGGYTPEKIALRRAIAHGLRPPGRDRRRCATGRRSSPRSSCRRAFRDTIRRSSRTNGYDPAAARALLDKFGYKDRDGDGYREDARRQAADDHQGVHARRGRSHRERAVEEEAWTRSASGSRSSRRSGRSSTRCRKPASCRCGACRGSASVPDAEPFSTPLYSKTIGTSNDARFRLPAYDQAYEAALLLPDGPRAHRALPQDDRARAELHAVAARRQRLRQRRSRNPGSRVTSRTPSSATSGSITTSSR